MDRKQEGMQFLGLFGICRESSKVIFSWRKIFSQITLAFVLPLAFVSLLYNQVSDVFSSKIVRKIGLELDETRPQTALYDKISDGLSNERAICLLFRALYLTVLHLSTLAIVYTITCIYTGREVAFRKVMSVVPRVWRRLMVTFLCFSVAMFTYSVIAALILVTTTILVGNTIFGVVIFILLGIAYLVGLVYMTLVWQLASVVSVLEEDYGVKAMIKSKDLIQGKMGVSIIIFFTLGISLYLVQFAFERLVVHGRSTGTLGRFGYGALCFWLLSVLMLFGLVVQTVIYFVCKSYHHENIDKAALSVHLEVYLGDHVPLKSKDVQFEQYGV